MSARVMLWIVAVVSVFLNGFLVFERKNQKIASLGKEQKIGNAANISDGFFAHLEKLSQDESQKGEYSKNIARISQVVIQEAKTHPDSMAYFFDEIVAAKFGSPWLAIQVLEYADEAVRQEMQRLKEESNIARLFELEKELTQARKEILEVREKEKLFSRAVPVLLHGRGNDIVKIKITDKLAQETKEYSVGMFVPVEAYLKPGEYIVEFTSELYPEVKHITSTFLVSPEVWVETLGKKYHAWVTTPDAY